MSQLPKSSGLQNLIFFLHLFFLFEFINFFFFSFSFRVSNAFINHVGSAVEINVLQKIWIVLDTEI